MATAPEHARRRLGPVGLTVLIGVAFEMAALVWTYAVAWGFTGPCTSEYTPELEVGSPRWDFCHNALGGIAIWGGLVVLPLAALYLFANPPRSRRSIVGILVVALGLAIAWPLVGLAIAHSISPTG